MDEPRDPSLETLLELHREVMLDGVRVMLPGRIVSYDATKQKADVQPLIKARHVGEDGETQVVEDLPVVHACPVVFCGPARGRITWPVAAGDTCELRFSSSSLSRWVLAGGSVDPGDDRHHDLSDGVAFVGLHDFAHVPTDAPTNAVVIHVSGGNLIKLGSSSASQSAILGDTYRSAEDTLLSAIGTFATAIAALDPLTSTAAAVTLNAAISSFQAAAASYLSTKTKLE